jgi:hypothetical protein
MVMTDEPVLDPLDLALLTALRRSPRAGILELSRLVRVLLSTVIEPRVMPLLASRPRASSTRAPAFRRAQGGN